MIDPDQPTAGRFDGSEHLFPVRVYFEDTDLSGVVYHANYLRWMERARSAMLRLAGIDQRAFHQAGTVRPRGSTTICWWCRGSPASPLHRSSFIRWSG
jgi:hypothetical protein